MEGARAVGRFLIGLPKKDRKRPKLQTRGTTISEPIELQDMSSSDSGNERRRKHTQPAPLMPTQAESNFTDVITKPRVRFDQDHNTPSNSYDARRDHYSSYSRGETPHTVIDNLKYYPQESVRFHNTREENLPALDEWSQAAYRTHSKRRQPLEYSRDFNFERNQRIDGQLSRTLDEDNPHSSRLSRRYSGSSRSPSPDIFEDDDSSEEESANRKHRTQHNEYNSQPLHSSSYQQYSRPQVSPTSSNENIPMAYNNSHSRGRQYQYTTHNKSPIPFPQQQTVSYKEYANEPSVRRRCGDILEQDHRNWATESHPNRHYSPHPYTHSDEENPYQHQMYRHHRSHKNTGMIYNTPEYKPEDDTNTRYHSVHKSNRDIDGNRQADNIHYRSRSRSRDRHTPPRHRSSRDHSRSSEREHYQTRKSSHRPLRSKSSCAPKSKSNVATIINVATKHPEMEKYKNSPHDSHSFEEHSEEFELQAHALSIHRDNWSRLVPLYLTEGALVVYKNLVEKKPYLADDYDLLKESLSKQFRLSTGATSSVDLYNRKKDVSESVGKFYGSICSMAKRLYPNMSMEARDQIILGAFLSGLPNSFKRGILNNHHINTAEKAFEVAQRYERTNDVISKDADTQATQRVVNKIDGQDKQNTELESMKDSLRRLELREMERSSKEAGQVKERWHENQIKSKRNNFTNQNRNNWNDRHNGNQNQSRYHNNNYNGRNESRENFGNNSNSNWRRGGDDRGTRNTNYNDRFQRTWNYNRQHEGQEFSTRGQPICRQCNRVGHFHYQCHQNNNDRPWRQALHFQSQSNQNYGNRQNNSQENSQRSRHDMNVGMVSEPAENNLTNAEDHTPYMDDDIEEQHFIESYEAENFTTNIESMGIDTIQVIENADKTKSKTDEDTTADTNSMNKHKTSCATSNCGLCERLKKDRQMAQSCENEIQQKWFVETTPYSAISPPPNTTTTSDSPSEQNTSESKTEASLTLSKLVTQFTRENQTTSENTHTNDHNYYEETTMTTSGFSDNDVWMSSSSEEDCNFSDNDIWLSEDGEFQSDVTDAQLLSGLVESWENDLPELSGSESIMDNPLLNDEVMEFVTEELKLVQHNRAPNNTLESTSGSEAELARTAEAHKLARHVNTANLLSDMESFQSTDRCHGMAECMDEQKRTALTATSIQDTGVENLHTDRIHSLKEVNQNNNCTQGDELTKPALLVPDINNDQLQAQTDISANYLQYSELIDDTMYSPYLDFSDLSQEELLSLLGENHSGHNDNMDTTTTQTDMENVHLDNLVSTTQQIDLPASCNTNSDDNPTRMTNEMPTNDPDSDLHVFSYSCLQLKVEDSLNQEEPGKQNNETDIAQLEANSDKYDSITVYKGDEPENFIHNNPDQYTVCTIGPATCTSEEEDMRPEINLSSLRICMYKAGALTLQDTAWLLTVYTLLYTVYLFTKELIHRKYDNYEPVSLHKCERMIENHAVHKHSLIGRSGTHTHYSTKPEYLYSYWQKESIINYEFTPGYAPSHWGSDKLQFTLADITRCEYINSECVVTEGTVIWHKLQTEQRGDDSQQTHLLDYDDHYTTDHNMRREKTYHSRSRSRDRSRHMYNFIYYEVD